MNGAKMKVYKLSIESPENGPKWVLFQGKKGQLLPWGREKTIEYFKNPSAKLPVGRNQESTPKKSNARFGDYSNVGHLGYPIFSARAKELFAPHFEGRGIWLELDTGEVPYWLFYCTNIADVLDVQASTLINFPSTGRHMAITSFAFKPDLVKDQFIFSVTQEPGKSTYVTDAFVKVVRDNQLTGFSFLRLWSSDTGPEPLEGVKEWLKPRMTGLEPEDQLV
jgi:hypothetical protein